MKTKVNWLDWNKESFEKAKSEDKPILLDLTAVWCHWCHVMDSTSYSDEDCAKIINEDFVPIKVYIDKRPDIRERYNMGGFPSTVFLNYDGGIIAGETYVPRERFKLVLQAVKDSHKSRKVGISKRIIDLDESIKKSEEAKKAELNDDIIKEVLLSIEDNFDNFYGGFGLQPKFPFPEVLDLLFIQYKKTNNKKYLNIALKTLDGMYKGIYDKIEFGFFRYSVAQDWKTPHYEKMLDTNAGLLRNYAVAYHITKNEQYKRISEGTIDYVNKFLSDQENGGFYGSQDADEEFYLAKPDERKKEDYPYVDKTIYADWNAMMISSYIKAGEILNDKKSVEFAIKTTDFILKNCYSSKEGLFHYFDGKPDINGLLNDNIYFLSCLIDTYCITQQQEYLKTHENQRFSGPRKSKRFSREIKEIAEFILNNFHDESNGGFFDRLLKEGDLGSLAQRNKQFLENSFCAITFLRLYFLTKEDKYMQASEKTLLYFADRYLNFGYFAAMYALAIDMLLNKDIKDIVAN